MHLFRVDQSDILAKTAKLLVCRSFSPCEAVRDFGTERVLLTRVRIFLNPDKSNSWQNIDNKRALKGAMVQVADFEDDAEQWYTIGE